MERDNVDANEAEVRVGEPTTKLSGKEFRLERLQSAWSAFQKHLSNDKYDNFVQNLISNAKNITDVDVQTALLLQQFIELIQEKE